MSAPPQIINLTHDRIKDEEQGLLYIKDIVQAQCSNQAKLGPGSPAPRDHNKVINLIPNEPQIVLYRFFYRH